MDRIKRVRWRLFFYDMIVWLIIAGILLWMNPSDDGHVTLQRFIFWECVGGALVSISRFAFGVYTQIWRYGGITAYMRLILADAAAGVVFIITSRVFETYSVRLLLSVAIVLLNLIAALAMRMCYYFFYRYASHNNRYGNLWRNIIRIFGGTTVKQEDDSTPSIDKAPVAIVGAGRVGSELAQQLVSNPLSPYVPVCFIETDSKKIGRAMQGLPIFDERDNLKRIVNDYKIKTVIFALPEMLRKDKQALFDRYKDCGAAIRSYDYPVANEAGGEKSIREFTIEDILQREPVDLSDEILNDYYKGRTVMVTGGGGSIGSELARQIAALGAKQLVVMDIAENTSYELQQELRRTYGDKLDLQVEICDMKDKAALDIVFARYNPELVIHAAAHKHVPLMEHNSVECIKNNVFGTQNVVNACLKYGTEHFIMVSTDKAVNPTNIMGASKRMCEMIVQAAAIHTKEYLESQGMSDVEPRTIFSATRFGNVLGSAGSVVPLFKRQIASGGPVTLTDTRINRYFMTIPEASKLVLTSGAMAQNGELFVLDMGEPVRIQKLAEDMIRLSGFIPYKDIDIVETGLRPGEKLFEELLISGENQRKTDNNLIFIESDTPIDNDRLMNSLDELSQAISAGDDIEIKKVMARAVPTYLAGADAQ